MAEQGQKFINKDEIISQLIGCFTKHKGYIDENSTTRKYIAYGTSGFRGRAEEIEHLFIKVGIFSGLRCLQKKGSLVGIMVTASHNPVQDNGVKLIDSNGQMLELELEKIVERFCNIESLKSLIEYTCSLMDNDLDMRNLQSSTRGLVMIACDSRPSSEHLVKLVKVGLEVLVPYVAYKDYGQLTTPALHWLVGESTNRGRPLEPSDYYSKLIHGVEDCFKDSRNLERYEPTKLVVDCANGVGSVTMDRLARDQSFNKYFQPELINSLTGGTNGQGVLNQLCGADYVKTKLVPPTGANCSGRRYASLDGDADRVVYFYLEVCRTNKQILHLLDGDKILALYAHFLVDTFKKYNLSNSLTLGAVQTAYANGASTSYMRDELGLSVDCVDTGVKYLHKKVIDYDIGVYFEANGHGTIWISKKAENLIGRSDAVELKHLLGILNNFTGDAISDILIVEMVLRHYDWSIQEWDKLYVDRPNCLTKVEIKDRNCIKTTDAGRTCIKPVGLQSEIDSLVNKFDESSRCFVRASGTENVVRIYAECSEQQDADELARLVGLKVIEICDKCEKEKFTHQ